MKIVYLYDSLALIGGLERILTDKMNYLADVYGYDVFLITSSQGNKPFAFPISSKVKHIDLGINIHHQYQYKYPKRIWRFAFFDLLFAEANMPSSRPLKLGLPENRTIVISSS